MTHPTSTILALSTAILLVYIGTADAKICIRPEQSAGVKGLLTCDGKPAVHVRVKLYDKDRCECVVVITSHYY